MLAELGGLDALRHQFMESGDYRQHPIGALAAATSTRSSSTTTARTRS